MAKLKIREPIGMTLHALNSDIEAHRSQLGLQIHYP